MEWYQSNGEWLTISPSPRNEFVVGPVITSLWRICSWSLQAAHASVPWTKVGEGRMMNPQVDFRLLPLEAGQARKQDARGIIHEQTSKNHSYPLLVPLGVGARKSLPHVSE